MDLDLDHGLRGILISLAAVMGVRLLVEISKAAWIFVNRHKIPTREELKNLTSALKAMTEGLAQQKTVTDKMAQDIHRVYTFLKVIAGAKWPTYLKRVQEIEKDNEI